MFIKSSNTEEKKSNPSFATLSDRSEEIFNRKNVTIKFGAEIFQDVESSTYR